MCVLGFDLGVELWLCAGLIGTVLSAAGLVALCWQVVVLSFLQVE